MSTLKTIIKIAKGDYDVLVEQGSITKGGVVYTYDPDETLYMVDDGLSDDYVVLGGGSGKLLSWFASQEDISNVKSQITNVQSDLGTDISSIKNSLSTISSKVDRSTLTYYNAYLYAIENIYAQSLAAFDEAGRLLSIQTVSGTGTNHIATTTSFRPDNIVFPVASTSAGNHCYGRYIYSKFDDCDIRYNFNTTVSSLISTTIYLVGKLDSETGLFTLRQTTNDYYLFFNNPTTTDNFDLSDWFDTGYDYIKIGNLSAYSRNWFILDEHNEVFHFDGTNLIPVSIIDTHNTSKNVVTGNANSTTNNAATNGNVYLNHIETTPSGSPSVTSSNKIEGIGGTNVSSDSSGNITIKNHDVSYATSTTDTRGHWTVTIPGITELYDGLKINIKLSTYWYGNGEYYNTLNVNGLGPQFIWWKYNNRLTSQFDIYAEIALTYRSSGCGSYTIISTTGELAKGTVVTSGWVCDYAYYSQNLEDLRYYYSNPYTSEAVYYQHLAAFDKTGKLLSITTKGGTYNASSNVFVPTATAFRPEDIVILIHDYNAGVLVGDGQLYTQRAYNYTSYNFNSNTTTPSTIYLVGTLDKTTGLFTLDQTTTGYYKFVPCDSTTITLSDYFTSGKYYIKVGVSYRNYGNFTLFAKNGLYYFDGTNLVPVIAYAKFADYAASADSAGIAGKATAATTDDSGNTISSTYFNKNAYNEVKGYTLFNGYAQHNQTLDLRGNLLLYGSDSMINGINGSKIVVPDYRVSTSPGDIAPKITGTTKQGYAVLNLTDQSSSSQSDIFVSGVRTPVDDSDAANKGYVDSELTTAINNLDANPEGSSSQGIKVQVKQTDGKVSGVTVSQSNTFATLGTDGKIPSSQLPSYVDDVLEYSSKSDFPSTGETGKIYVATDTNLTYRWSGTAYVEISQSLALGETSSTAYYGDKGKTAYDHSQVTSGNPHKVTKSDVGLGNVDNTADSNKSVKYATSAGSATKLTTARSINGTSFNGTADITTSKWGTARNVSISDSDGSNTGTAVSVDGSDAVTLKLPATIKATLKGNADTATTAVNAGTAELATVATTANSVAWSNVTEKPNSGTYIASTTKNGYEGLTTAAGSDTSWIRTTESGLIPYSSSTSGSSSLGTSGWPFKTVYAKTFYGNLSGTVTGNASTATKLQTPRTISLGTGVTSTATSFSGESNITIPVNSIYESYLAWGGKNIAGDISPLGMSISAEHSANRLAFINGDALTFEYSSDGGSTWTDYNYPASTKSAWCTSSTAVPIGRPNNTTDITLDMQTRVTLTAQDGTSDNTHKYVYTSPKKLLIQVSSAQSQKVKIEYKTGNGTSWITYGEYALSGWSGWNEIPLILGTLGGGYNQTGNIWYLRLTFIVTSLWSTYPKHGDIYAIRLFGTNDWGPASANNGKGPMSSTGHLYSYDINANATFPAAITAKGNGIFYGGIYEGGASNTNLLSNKYASKSHTHTKSQITDFSVTTADIVNSAVTTDKIAAGSITPVKISSDDDNYWHFAHLSAPKGDIVVGVRGGSYSDIQLSNANSANGIPILTVQGYDGEAGAFIYDTTLRGINTPTEDNDAANKGYVDSELTTALSGKADSSHNHNDIYYTEAEMNTKLSSKVDNTAAGVSTALNKLTEGTSTPSDSDYYISQYAGGGTTTTTYHRRPLSALWNWIKSKLAMVATSGSYTDLANKPTSLKNPSVLAIGTADTAVITYDGSEVKGLTIQGGGATTVTGDATANSITISSTGADYTAGTGISISGTTISNSGVTGVKGAADSVYKTGNVNLTPANIGAASSSHTHSNASTTAAGFMSAADKTNLNNLISFIAYDDINVAADGEVATDVCDEIRDMVYAGIGCAVVVGYNSSAEEYSTKYPASISINSWTSDTNYILNITVYFSASCTHRLIRREDSGAYVLGKTDFYFSNTSTLTKDGTLNMSNGGVWSAINTPTTTAISTAVTPTLTSTSPHRILHTATAAVSQTYTLPASPVANETFVFYKLFTASTLTIKTGSSTANMYNIKTGSITKVSSISYTVSSTPSRCKITCIYNGGNWYVICENLAA